MTSSMPTTRPVSMEYTDTSGPETVTDAGVPLTWRGAPFGRIARFLAARL